MKTNKRWVWICVVLVSIGYSSCSDMTSIHEQYLKRGETIYVTQADSIKIYSGKNRVKITYRNYDPKVSKLIVYRDFRLDSALFDVPDHSLGEEIEVIVDQLEEKQYTFELVTSNREGKYPSVPSYISGPVYGSKYEATLSDKKIVNATFFPLADNRVDISWASAIDRMVGVELVYRNLSNTETTRKVLNDELNTRITDSGDGEVRYRTLHLPENCIDTFYTAYTSIDFALIEDEQLDRTKFTRWNPPGIPYVSYGGGYDVENLWSLSINDQYLIVAPLPLSITFSLGQSAKLNRFKLWHYKPDGFFMWYAPRKFQIWGSPHPDVTENFDDWILLGEFESIKPSGLPEGEFTEEDLARGEAGEEYYVKTENIPPIQYIRIHSMENWWGGANFSISEMEFYGVIQE